MKLKCKRIEIMWNVSLCFARLFEFVKTSDSSAVKKRHWFALPVWMHSFKSIIWIFSPFTRVVLHLFRQNCYRQEHTQPRFFFSFINDVFSELCNSVTCKEKHLVLSYCILSAVITQFEPNNQNTWLIYCRPCGFMRFMFSIHIYI